ncbi:helix-turn-helix domain-containing protein [Echinicola sp. 20G]|uniref:helix-turn-helix domain-containing protein n=1 Tax=Echinicola sp. 20G TaxID=2781961 RepID=UPI001910ABE3|nr:helix-turn-helix domain-containing protein [Echinicola sp. 20G]
MDKREAKFAEIVQACIDDKDFKTEAIPEYHTLIRVLSGEMKIVSAEESYTFGPGEILLVPRNQLCMVIKRPKDDIPYKSIAIAFKTERLKAYYSKVDLKTSLIPIKKILSYPPHALLESYFASLEPYFELKSQLPEEITKLKIKEGIGILRSIYPGIDGLLADFSEPGKVDLKDYMEKNYMFNMPLDKFSYLTGRSLATFNRDFRKAFQTPPQRWLIQKRLQLAYHLLKENNKKPIEVYIESGFENLSHFSYLFKKTFGHSPSQLI